MLRWKQSAVLPGETIDWTYMVTNNGDVTFDAANA